MATIENSKDLTGCELVYKNPFQNNSTATPTAAPTVTTDDAPYGGPAGQPNICATPSFTYP